MKTNLTKCKEVIKSLLYSRSLNICFLASMVIAFYLHYYVILGGKGAFLPGYVDQLAFLWAISCMLVVFVALFLDFATGLVVTLFYRAIYDSPCRADGEACAYKRENFTRIANLGYMIVFIFLLIIGIPHIYAARKIEPLWQDWQLTHDSRLSDERDRILRANGFDYSTSWRYWEGYLPGLYLPAAYLKMFGVPQRQWYDPESSNQ